MFCRVRRGRRAQCINILPTSGRMYSLSGRNMKSPWRRRELVCRLPCCPPIQKDYVQILCEWIPEMGLTLPSTEFFRPYAYAGVYYGCVELRPLPRSPVPPQPFLRCDTRAFIIRYSGKYRMSPWIPVSAGCTNRCTPSPSSFSFVRLRPPNFLSYIFLTPQLSLLSPPLHPHIHPLRRFLSLPAALPALVFPSSPCFPQGHCTLHICSSSPPPLHLSWELILRRWPFAVVRSVRHKHQSPPPPPLNPSEMDASQVKSCSSPSQSTTSERRDALHSCSTPPASSAVSEWRPAPQLMMAFSARIEGFDAFGQPALMNASTRLSEGFMANCSLALLIRPRASSVNLADQ